MSCLARVSKRGSLFLGFYRFLAEQVWRLLCPSVMGFFLCISVTLGTPWLVLLCSLLGFIMIPRAIPLHSFVELRRDNILISYSLHPLHCFTQKLLINHLFSRHGTSLRHYASHISLALPVYLAISNALRRISTL